MTRLLILLSLILFTTQGFGQTKPSIAVLYTKSGDITEDFENLTEVVRFTMDYYNKNHQQNLSLNIIEVDDKADPDFAEKSLQKIMDKEKLIGIIGPLYSNVALSLKSFIEKNKIPMISVFATHNDLTKNSKYMFRICSSNKSLVKMLTNQLLPQIQKNKLNVTVFKDLSDFYSTDLADTFKQSLSSAKINVNEVLFRGQGGLERLKDINSKAWSPSKKDLLILPTQDVVSSKILTAMESEPYLLATIEPVNFQQIINKMKKRKLHIRLMSTSQWLPQRSEFSTKVEQSFKEKFGREMKISSALTFDATLAFLSALTRSEKNQIPLATALKDGTKVLGVTGSIVLGPDGERVSPQTFIKEDILQ